MTTEFFPHQDLGMPLRDGYSVAVNTKINEKEVYGGTPRFRAFNPLGNMVIEVRFVLNTAQMTIFKDFYENNLNYGSEYFFMLLRGAEGISRGECLIRGGYRSALRGADSHLLRFSCYVKKEVNTAPPDPAGRDIIDALYGSYPAQNIIYDARIMNNYYPPLIFQDVVSGHQDIYVSNPSSLFFLQGTFKDDAEIGQPSIVDPGNING